MSKVYYVKCETAQERDALIEYATERGVRKNPVSTYPKERIVAIGNLDAEEVTTWTCFGFGYEWTELTSDSFRRKVRKLFPKKEEKSEVVVEKRGVTMEDLKRQQDRIETVLCQMSEFLREATDKAVLRIDNRTREDGKALKELYHTTNKIEREVSLIRSGASFMRELEQAKPAEEQGLEPGDYTDASKEVADELTAMGWKWDDTDRWCHPYIIVGWSGIGSMRNTGKPSDTNHTHHQAEFLRRARVTAKRLGLVPVEQPKPWKPEAGSFVKFLPDTWQEGEYDGVIKVDRGPDEEGHFWTAPVSEYKKGICFATEHAEPVTPEEVAKYHADQEAAAEAAKPILPYETKVMHNGMEWCLGGPDPAGDYDLHRKNDDGSFSSYIVKRSDFKVIDP